MDSKMEKYKREKPPTREELGQKGYKHQDSGWSTKIVLEGLKLKRKGRDNNQRKKWVMMALLYGAALGYLIYFLVQQIPRINVEVGVKTSYEKETEMVLPTVVVCRPPTKEYFQVGYCQHSQQAGTVENCINKIKPVKPYVGAISSSLLQNCFYLESGIIFNGRSHAVTFSFAAGNQEHKDYLYVASHTQLGYVAVIPHNIEIKDGVDLSDPRIMFEPISTEGITFMGLRKKLYKYMNSTDWDPEFTAIVNTVPMRLNYSFEAHRPGGRAMTILGVVVTLDSLMVEKVEFYPTYTFNDLLSGLGGVLGMIGGVITLILGPGLYDARGMMHRLRLVQPDFDQTWEEEDEALELSHNSHGKSPYVALK